MNIFKGQSGRGKGIVFYSGLMLLLFLFSSISYAADSIIWQVTDSGGRISNHGDYELLDASGQGAIGRMDIPGYTLLAGYILPVNGSILIASTPSDANIYFDGIDKGTITPAILTGITPGTHTIKLTKAGYYDWTGTVNITAETTTAITATLTVTISVASGSLINKVAELEAKVIPKNSGGYVSPANPDRTTMAGVVQLIKDGIINHDESRLNQAAVMASPLEYELVEFSDTITSRIHYILQEREPFNRGWGSYIFDSNPGSSWVIEAPHPLFDVNTPEIGIKTYIECEAGVFLMAGAHRDANGTGTADVAHLASSIFQSVHETVVSSATYNFQVHGFSRTNHPGYPDVVLSTGDGSQPDSLIRIARKISNKGFSVGIYDGIKWADLGATTNVQGSYTRGIGGKFIHIELVSSLRGSSTQYSRVIQSIEEAFMPTAPVGPIFGIGSSTLYLVYYGNWDVAKVKEAERFKLVILHPDSNITAEQISDIRDGADNIAGNSDDVIVIGYLSIGEHDVDTPLIGDATGPGGYASWYLDADGDNYPDKNGAWGSFYVNSQDTNWQQLLKTATIPANGLSGADEIIHALGCDGLFLDTIDTASPWGSYSSTAAGMSSLIREIRDWYPNKYLIANRGLFYYSSDLVNGINYNQWSPHAWFNGVMFECYYTEWDWDNQRGTISPYFANNKGYWAGKLNTVAAQPDGFTVFCLDYLSGTQSDYATMLATQIDEAINQQGWADYVSHVNLNEIRYYQDGTLSITSTPAGANIFLDGTDTSMATPAVLTDIIPGNHTIKLTKAGYEDWYGTVTVIAGSTTYVYAALTQTPQNVNLSNVRDTQFTISWITETLTKGQINYGTTTAPGNIAYDDRGTETIDDTHHITIKKLMPNTTYYYDIVSGTVTDNNNGQHYIVTTGPSIIPSGSDVVYGKVFKQDGITPAEGAIVYLKLQDVDNQGSPRTSALASVLVDINGYWFIDLVNFRTQDYQSLFNYSTAGDALWLFAQGGRDGTTTQTVDTNNDSPASEMILVEYQGTPPSLLPDLTVTSIEFYFPNPDPDIYEPEVELGSRVSIKAFITNQGSATASEIKVSFYDGDRYIKQNLRIGSLAPGKRKSIVISQWKIGLPFGTHTIKVVVDPENKIEEVYENNNENCSDLMVVLDKGAISGTVTDIATGRPIQKALITAWNGRLGFVWAFTDGNGQYLISPLAPGSYTLIAFKSGYSTEFRTVTVLAREIINENFALSRQPLPAPLNKLRLPKAEIGKSAPVKTEEDEFDRMLSLFTSVWESISPMPKNTKINFEALMAATAVWNWANIEVEDEDIEKATNTVVNVRLNPEKFIDKKFDLKVVVDKVEDLMGLNIKLSFDSNLLEVISIDKGELLSSNNSNVKLFNNMDNSNGVIEIFSSLVGGNPIGLTGAGDIAVIKFRVKSPDLSINITWDKCDLRNSYNLRLENIPQQANINIGNVLPQDVNLSNVRDTQFTISWITATSATCSVHYGTTTTTVGNIAYDDRGTETIDDTHHITIKKLEPNTTYYYDIISGTVTDNNNGQYYTITTGPSIIPSGSDVVHGNVFKQGGTTPASGTIVYLKLQDTNNQGSLGTSALASVLADINGYWSIDLVNFRTQDYQGLFNYSTSGDTLWLFAQGGSDGTATQTVDTNNDSPAPGMILAFMATVLPGTSNLTNIIVYPNPCYVSKGQQLHFKGLTAQCTIKIFNIVGELVKEIEHTNGTDEEVWTNPGSVASGIYIYLITDPAGNKKVGKLGILR